MCAGMKIFLALTWLLSCLSPAQAQSQTNCLNTLAYNNPMMRTTCYNATWFILPVPKSAVQSLVPYPLLTPPFSDKSIFPTGFPAGAHPVVASTGFGNDIRQINLKIQSLLTATIIVPYVDVLQNGRTPFNHPIQTYIGGVEGQPLGGLVPAVVGTAGGTTIFLGGFSPDNDAYAPLASNPNEYVAQVRKVIVSNPISGPGIEPPAFDFNFVSTRTSLYTRKTFHAMINQPQTLTNGQCQRNTYYFNETFADPVLRTGNATLYGPARAGSVPTALDNRYVKQGAYSVAATLVGYNAESCASAAINLDPESIE